MCINVASHDCMFVDTTYTYYKRVYNMIYLIGRYVHPLGYEIVVKQGNETQIET